VVDFRAAGVRLTSVEIPAPRSEWLELLAADGDALLEQGPSWVDALGEADGSKDTSRLYRFDDGRRFVLPLVRRRAHRLAPQSGYRSAAGIGGLVGPGLDEAVVAAIDADLQQCSALWVHVRPNPSQGDVWSEVRPETATTLPRRAHLLRLARDSDEVFAACRASARRHIRRAERQGVEYRTTTAGAGLDTYYDELFIPSVERWAAKQNEPLALARLRAGRRDPLARLQAIGRSLGSSFRLTMAYVDDRVAAGNIVLVGPNAHYTRGAMNERAEKTGAAYGAMWHAISQCCDDRLDWFHLGETGSSASLASYKEAFGAEPVDYHEYRYEKLPLLAVDQRARSLIKSLIRFNDA
jgi:hypothetical protein